MNLEKVERLMRELLIEIGEDPDREGLRRTPFRVAASFRFLTAGYHEQVDQLVNGAIFKQEIEEMIIARDIELFSLCEHHMLPIIGRCHIGYIANGRIFGLSKLVRLMNMYARRLQVQERLTEQIAHAVMGAIQAEGVGVIIEARHLCMMMRGVEKQSSIVTTSSLLGTFRKSATTRAEFINLAIRPRRSEN
jgi:GTP cyclohydrolase I